MSNRKLFADFDALFADEACDSPAVLRQNTIKKMSPSEVGEVCEKVMPELNKIYSREIKSRRHEVYLELVRNSILNMKPVRDMTLGPPFSSQQERSIQRVIEEKFLAKYSGTDRLERMTHYAVHVLVPEALIRIYAIVNNISIELAEKELK